MSSENIRETCSQCGRYLFSPNGGCEYVGRQALCNECLKTFAFDYRGKIVRRDRTPNERLL